MKNTKNRPKFNTIRKKLKHYFAKREEILFAFLFGSIANDKTTSISDIDIAITNIEGSGLVS
jgi:predicted nucleotidyltransferase